MLAQRILLAVGLGLVDGGAGAAEQILELVPIRGGSLGLALALELTGFVDLARDLGNEGLEVAAGGGDILLGVFHAGNEAIRHLAGVLDIANKSHQRALLAGRLGLDPTGLVEQLLGLIERSGGKLGVIGNGGEHVLVIVGLQAGQRGLGLRQAGAQAHGALGELVQLFIGVDEQIAHLGKLLGLRIEGIIGLAAGRDDFYQHLAALGRGLRHGIIQALAQVEGLLQGRGGVVHCLGKGAHALGTEFGKRDIELLLAAADGLIGRDQLLLGQLVQGLQRQATQLVGVTRGNLAGGLQRLRIILLGTAARVVHDSAAGGDNGGRATA